MREDNLNNDSDDMDEYEIYDSESFEDEIIEYDDRSILNRSITIDFPAECSIFPGAQSLTVSIRDLLAWYIELGPIGDRERVSCIRDNFFGGDEPDDYETGLMITDGFYGPERRASVRWELDQGKADRSRKKAEFDDDLQKYEADEQRRWLPLITKRAEIEAERDAQYARAAALDEEWFAFVCRIKTDKSLTKQWIGERRARLQAKTEKLVSDQEKTCEAYAELRAQVLDKN